VSLSSALPAFRDGPVWPSSTWRCTGLKAFVADQFDENHPKGDSLARSSFNFKFSTNASSLFSALSSSVYSVQPKTETKICNAQLIGFLFCGSF
jgi:hypothetical protein